MGGFVVLVKIVTWFLVHLEDAVFLLEIFS